MTVIPPSPSEDSDLQLVERTVAGDQRAYELLVIKYQRRIERLIGRMVRDASGAMCCQRGIAVVCIVLNA